MRWKHRQSSDTQTRRLLGAAVLGLLVGALIPLLPEEASATTSAVLTRYPYLTDSIQTSITVNWATDTSATSAA
jgi:hypothetical protein